MTKRVRAVVGGILGAGGWWLMSCGDSGTGPPPGPPECTDQVAISVTIDSVPVFSWTPECTIGRLIVEQGFDEYWGTETCGQNTYQSPIRYGVNPPNTCPEEFEKDLARGLRYQVSLWRFFTVTPESLQLLGSTEFTYLSTPPECADSVTVTVGFDTLPIFTWTPDCTIGRVRVEQGANVYWDARTCGQNSYQTPIHYSTHPPNTCAEEPPVPLVAGLTYTVSVWRFVTAMPESLQLLGSSNFVY